MKRRQYVLAIIGALSLMSPSLLTGLSHSHQQAWFSVEVRYGGPIEAYASFLPTTTSSNVDSDPGSMVISVLDERGSASGWTVVFASRATFFPQETTDVDSQILVAGVIEVHQGNRELAGHSIQAFGSVAVIDSVRWTTVPQSGDGQYALTLEGTTPSANGGSSGAHIVVVTMYGSAP
jgi:hypothetical protein